MSEIMQSAIDKVDTESEAGGDQMIKLIAQYIIENLIVNDLVAQKVLTNEKSLNNCIAEIRSKAQKRAVKQCAVIEDSTVWHWVHEYFGVTDADIEKKQAGGNILAFDMFSDL